MPTNTSTAAPQATAAAATRAMPSGNYKPSLRTPGSAILAEYKAAMEARRAGISMAAAVRPGVTQMARSFEVAEQNAFTAGWAGWDASINAILQSALPMLVARSRRWSRNTGAGRRFLNQVRDGVVGPTGFNIQMRCGDWRKEKNRWVFKLDKLANDAIERAFTEWCKPGNCEATGKLSFADVCKLTIEQTARDGEHLMRHLRGADNAWRYQLQVLSTDRLDVQHNELPFAGGGDEVRMGVHRNEVGRPTNYSILRYSPGDVRTSRVADKVPAADVLHGFIPLDAEQARGVPWSHAVLIGSSMLSTFQNYAVYAAQAGASQMGFFIQSSEAGAPIQVEDLGAKDDGTGKLSKEMAPGALDLLPKGITDFKPFIGQFPSETFGPFVNAAKQEISSGLNVAHHNHTGDMTKVNYSSARISELGERDGWRGIGHWFTGATVEPVFRAWLEMALLADRITLADGTPLSVTRMDKYMAGLTVRGRGWDWVDPLKEVTAAALALQEGFTTRSQVVAGKGGDFEDNVIEIAQEKEILTANGVTLGPPPMPGQPMGDAGTSKPASNKAARSLLQRALDLINSGASDD